MAMSGGQGMPLWKWFSLPPFTLVLGWDSGWQSHLVSALPTESPHWTSPLFLWQGLTGPGKEVRLTGQHAPGISLPAHPAPPSAAVIGLCHHIGPNMDQGIQTQVLMLE